MTAEAENTPPLSLLSLSLAAAASQPLPQPPNSPTAPTQHGNGSAKPQTRRLSSASLTRRRLSDAREAGIRATQGQNIAGLNSAAAALTLSSSPPMNVGSEAFAAASSLVSGPQKGGVLSAPLASSLPTTSPFASSMGQYPKIQTLPTGHQTFNGTLSVGALETLPPPSSQIVGSKKKGTIFRCESCSKVYRHPSCLVKHRWEHSPHWKEANKFLLSKHQQVQLLEAAAILSHITPTATRTSGGPATSLPDDRSLWPSYLSAYVPPEEAIEDEEEDNDDVEDLEGDGDIDVEDDKEREVTANGDDLDMDFDMGSPTSSSATAPGLLGPISSSVPTSFLGATRFISSGVTIPQNVISEHTAAQAPYSQGYAPGHHRTRSRSRSVSKSIHKNTIMTVRGIPAKASSGVASGIMSLRSAGGIAERDDKEVKVNAGVGVTLRPGLIAVPATNQSRSYGHSVASSLGTTTSAKKEDSSTELWNAHRGVSSFTGHTPTSWSSSSSGTAPISMPTLPGVGQSTSYTSSSIRSTGFGPGSLSLPRSSLRSSSSFVETDEPSSLEEEDEEDERGVLYFRKEGSTGSNDDMRHESAAAGAAGADLKGKGGLESEWDGDQMEMEIGY